MALRVGYMRRAGVVELRFTIHDLTRADARRLNPVTVEQLAAT